MIKAFIAAVVVFGAVGSSASAKTLYHWVELGEGETASVRAITDGGCPEVVFDGVAMPLSVRAAPGKAFANIKAASFPVTACELRIPASAKSARL